MKNEVFYLPRLADLYRQAERRSIPACSLFLSEAEQQETVRFCRAEKIPPPFFWGGHVDAERKMACFLPADTELDAFKNSAPIAAVYAKASESGLSHRDYLGTLLGLGIARAAVGDIYVWPDAAWVFLSEQVAPFVLAEMKKAGRIPLHLIKAAVSGVQIPQKNVENREFTVSTPRFDSVLAGLFRLSRSEAARVIAEGRAFLNQAAVLKPDARVEAGDTLSVRGLGKGRVMEFSGLSKKGRVFIRTERYL